MLELVVSNTGGRTVVTAPGIQGPAGSKWLNGTGVPSNSLGVNGDNYLATSTGDIYSKESGSWVFKFNNRGATGPAGPQGIQGPVGPVGPAGATGPAGAAGADGAPGATGAAGSGVTIKGTLPGGAWSAPVSPTTGDMWIANGTITGGPPTAIAGDGIVYNGASWTNVGQIRGPAGATGPAGPAGSTDYTTLRVLPSYSDLLALAASAPSGQVPAAVLLKGYHSDNPGVGDGTWMFYSSSTRATSLGFAAVASGGCFEPNFPNGGVDPTMFGCRHLVTNDAAFNEAWALAEDLSWNRSNHIYLRALDFQVTTTKGRVAVGNAKGYRVNQPTPTTGYPVGATAINVDTGTGTFNVGAGITFQSHRNGRYRVTGVTTVSGNMTQIQISPPLIAAVADNDTIFGFIPKTMIRGTGHRSMTSDFARFQNCPVVRMMTDNTPLFELSGHEGSIVGICAEFNNYQPPANTEAKLFKMKPGTDLLRWEYRNIGMRRCAYGFFLDPLGGDGGSSTSGRSIANSRFDHIYCISASITAMHLGAAGTTCEASNIYLQNIDDRSSNQGTITGYSRSGVALTLTLSSLPPNVAVGSYTVTDGLQGVPDGTPSYNNQFVVKSITGAGPYTITADYATAPVDPAVSGGGTLYCNSGSESGGPMLYIGAGLKINFGACDLENKRSNVAGSTLLCKCLGDATFSNVHYEYTGGTGGNMRFFETEGQGNMTFLKVDGANISIPPGDTHYVFSNRGTGSIRVDSHTVRDIAAVPGASGTLKLARNDIGSSRVLIGEIHKATTVRANATSDTDNAGLLTTKLTEYQMRDVENRPLKIVAAGCGSWGSMQGQVQAQSTGFCCIVLPRPVFDMMGVWTGLCRKTEANLTLPIEEPIGNDQEIHVTVQRVDPVNRVTAIGDPVEFTFMGGREKWTLVRNGSFHKSDPMGWWAAGTYIVRTFGSRLQSTGVTVAGETGRIASDGAYLMRHNNLGGSLGLIGIGGQISSNSGPLVPGTLDRTGAGAYTASSFGGPAPVAFLGRFADTGSSIRPWCIFSDSIGDGSGDVDVASQPLSGLGWVIRGWNHRLPYFQGSKGGNDVKYFVGQYVREWAKRAELASKCDGAFVHLGTNGLAAGDSAETVIANLTEFFAMLRAMGFLKINTATILPRSTSTDGWRTVANQTPVTGGSLTNFQSRVNTVNAWLLSAASLVDWCVDLRSTMESSPGSGKWKEGTDIMNVTTAGVPTTTAIPVTQTLTLNQLQGLSISFGGVTRVITSNTAGSGGTAVLTVVAFGSAPAAGVTSMVFRPPTVDGIHMSAFGNLDAAAKMDADFAKFLIEQ